MADVGDQRLSLLLVGAVALIRRTRICAGNRKSAPIYIEYVLISATVMGYYIFHDIDVRWRTCENCAS